MLPAGFHVVKRDHGARNKDLGALGADADFYAAEFHTQQFVTEEEGDFKTQL